MRILAIDTSCDETSAAVTEDTKILSNVVWSQASQHASFGGVMPSLAQRLHKERIDWVVDRAMLNAKCQMSNIDSVAVTVGPGLAIALGVGIDKAKKIAKKYRKKIIPINHIEGHLLSPLTQPSTIKFPALGLVVSGGNTQLILIKKIGQYDVLARTVDDALGEALDKGARLLGLGYPGGEILEKFSREGNPKAYPLPIPLKDDRIKNRFSYSGLKTAMYRLIQKARLPDGQEKPLTKEKIYNLAASFQEVAFDHILRVVSYQITNHQSLITNHFLLGGGVANNNLLRSKLRKLLKPYGITLLVPYSKKLCGDNAAMVGLCAYLKLKTENEKLRSYENTNSIDRKPRMEL